MICFTLVKNFWDAILKLKPKQGHWKERAIDDRATKYLHGCSFTSSLLIIA